MTFASIHSTKTMAAHDFNIMLAADSYKVGEQVLLDIQFLLWWHISMELNCVQFASELRYRYKNFNHLHICVFCRWNVLNVILLCSNGLKCVKTVLRAFCCYCANFTWTIRWMPYTQYGKGCWNELGRCWDQTEWVESSWTHCVVSKMKMKSCQVTL